MATNRVDGYLDEAVESVLNSIGVEIELVLVLDGVHLPESPPEWTNNPGITLVPLAQSNGLPTALNAGIRAAKHEVIARLDADDNALPNRFVQQLKALTGLGAPVLVGSKTVLIDENGAEIGAPQQVCGDDIRRELLLQNVVPHSTYMLRKDAAMSIGLYNEDLRQMEDYDFLLRIAQQGPIAVLCEPLVQYRVHSGQMSKKANWRANYISAVTTGRRELGKLLGVSAIEVHAKNLIWRLVQIARSTGILKPRYLIGVKKNELQT